MDQYFYLNGEEILGPISLRDLIASVRGGTMSPATLVGKHPIKQWVAARIIVETVAKGANDRPQQHESDTISGKASDTMEDVKIGRSLGGNLEAEQITRAIIDRLENARRSMERLADVLGAEEAET